MNVNDTNRQELGKWLRLHLTEGVGARTFAKLLEHFGTIDDILQARCRDLIRVPKISQKLAEKIVQGVAEADIDAELNLAAELNISIIPIAWPDYPLLLKHIPDPPHVLYVKGDLLRQDELAVAMVGSRTCSQYGFEQASRLAHLAAAAGFTVVSGLARGIDSACHRGALAAGGRTIAVQGCGLSMVYPPENQELGELISHSGAVVSELPLRTGPQAGHFPARNRIIAGLSLGTLLVEARRNSGAKGTVTFAIDYHREVLAVPGRIDSPGSELPHALIRDGARLVERIDDIVDTLLPLAEHYKIHAKAVSGEVTKKMEATLFDVKQLKLNPDESRIVQIMEKEPLHIDQIINQTGLDAGPANAALTALQLKGALKQLPGGYYRLRSNI